jgi:hypothetical protein
VEKRRERKNCVERREGSSREETYISVKNRREDKKAE